MALPASPPAAAEPWGMLEVFVLAQYLTSALLFVPAAQAWRTPVRAFPYILSLALLLWYQGKIRHVRPLPRWAPLLVLALLLLVINLFRPSTNLPAGIAQCLFQLSIAAPVFWAAVVVRSRERLVRLVWLVFLANGLSAAVGVLQVYYPGTFMPPEFSALALALNPDAVTSLTFIGADGREIVRPPGLTDFPGGASVAGMTAGLFGIVLAAQVKAPRWRRLFCMGVATVGVATLYLTQVRSLLMILIVSLAVMSLLLVRQRQPGQGTVVAALSAALLAVAFLWATAVGGESVSSRFLGLVEEGPLRSFQANRGGFLTNTFSDLLFQYPLGAGLGRWGMMNVHFGAKNASAPPPIHVEIQPTGWLLDGGIPMWFLYGGAILLALLFVYRVAMHSRDAATRFMAVIIFGISLIVAVQTLAGPAFNTQLGTQFWLLTTALYGVVRQRARRDRAPGTVRVTPSLVAPEPAISRSQTP